MISRDEPVVAGVQAVILAAGQGKRLLPLTQEIPKALLPVDPQSNTTILEFQVSALRNLGVKEILVVVGHGKERVFSKLGDGVQYVDNPKYLTTNSIYSFFLAMDRLGEDVLILNGDVLFHPEVVTRLLNSDEQAVLSVDTGAVLDEETMKVRLNSSRVVEISKSIEANKADGENLGIVRFGGEGLRCLKRVVGNMIKGGEVNRWIPAAFQRMLGEFPIYAVDVKGLPWIEIDFVGDLEKAREEVFGEIMESLR